MKKITVSQTQEAISLTATQATTILTIVKKSESSLSDVAKIRRVVRGNVEAENWLKANEPLFRYPVPPLKNHPFSPT